MKLSVHIFDTIHVVIVKSKYLYGHELVNGVHFGSIERKIWKNRAHPRYGQPLYHKIITWRIGAILTKKDVILG